MKEGTFELKCGITLHLQQVSQTAIRPILLRFGNVRLFEHPEELINLEGRAMERAIEATQQLFNYCAGWGVKNDPPEEAIEELEEIGFRVNTPRLARINWLRYLCLDGDEEMGSLISAVMGLTYAPEVEKILASEETSEMTPTEDIEDGD